MPAELGQDHPLIIDHQRCFRQMHILMNDDFFQFKGVLQMADVSFVQALNAGDHAGMGGDG